MVEYRPVISAKMQARPTHGARREHDHPLRKVFASNRYVLGSALLIAIGLPIAVYATILNRQGQALNALFLAPTYVAATFAIVLGHFSLRRIGGLPLVNAGGLVFPAFVASYGVALAFLSITRSPISLTQLGASFLLALAWYVCVSVMRNRYLHPVIGLIGATPEESAELSERADWHILLEPRLPQGVSALAYDPHAPLSMRWSTFITNMVLRGVPVYHLAHIEEGLSGKVRFNHHSENEFGALLPSLFYLRLKRMVDVVVALLLLPLIAIVIGVAAMLIRLESPGPAFFKQVRMGHRGRPFVCLKLRSMRNDVDGPAFTVEKDPRITKLGAHLRKWRIDELPQVFHVISGEMSWIGPRPEAMSLARHYARHVPFYGYRHAVRPGITGWAAVHQGNVAEVEAAQEKLEYDFFYIRYFSVWLDLLIVVKTIRTILTGFGSR